MLRFELSNKNYVVKRVYGNLIDFFVDVGGVGEIIIFTFVLVLTLHSDIVKDLYLLNECLLKDNRLASPQKARTN